MRVSDSFQVKLLKVTVLLTESHGEALRVTESSVSHRELLPTERGVAPRQDTVVVCRALVLRVVRKLLISVCCLWQRTTTGVDMPKGKPGERVLMAHTLQWESSQVEHI